MMHHFCIRCRRRLKAEKAQRAGIGAACAAKLKQQSINQLKLNLKPTNRIPDRHATK